MFSGVIERDQQHEMGWVFTGVLQDKKHPESLKSNLKTSCVPFDPFYDTALSIPTENIRRTRGFKMFSRGTERDDMK